VVVDKPRRAGEPEQRIWDGPHVLQGMLDAGTIDSPPGVAAETAGCREPASTNSPRGGAAQEREGLMRPEARGSATVRWKGVPTPMVQGHPITLRGTVARRSPGHPPARTVSRSVDGGRHHLGNHTTPVRRSGRGLAQIILGARGDPQTGCTLAEIRHHQCVSADRSRRRHETPCLGAARLRAA